MTSRDALQEVEAALAVLKGLGLFCDPRLDALRRLKLAQLEGLADALSVQNLDAELPEQGFLNQASVSQRLLSARKLAEPGTLRRSAEWMAAAAYHRHVEAVELVVGRRPQELLLFPLDDGEGPAFADNGLALYLPTAALVGEELNHFLLRALVSSTQERIEVERVRLRAKGDQERLEATRILVAAATEHICLAAGAPIDRTHTAEMATLETVSVQLESPVLELALVISHAAQPLEIVARRVEFDEPFLVEGILDLFAEYSARIAPSR